MKTICLDQAATSFPKAPGTAEAMIRYINEIGSNINRSSYSTAFDAEDTVFETRRMLTDMFNGGDLRNVIFTPNVTTSLNFLIKGILKPGDHVLVSSVEHNAVMRPLNQLLASGVTFDRIPCTKEGFMITDEIEKMIRPNTKALITTHASNVSGAVMPLAIIGEICRRYGIIFIVDSAQTAGTVKIDMQEMNIDALAFTGHKSLLGPQGIGGFIIREELVSHIEPVISGGTGSISHTEEIPAFMPDRFEPGTPNIPGIYGLNASLRFINETGTDRIREHELKITRMFIRGLREIEGAVIHGPSEDEERTSVVAVTFSERDTAEIAAELDEKYGILTRVGLHCAPSAHKTLGTYPEGVLRFSFGYFNTEEEIDIALNALKEVLHGY